MNPSPLKPTGIGSSMTQSRTLQYDRIYPFISSPYFVEPLVVMVPSAPSDDDNSELPDLVNAPLVTEYDLDALFFRADPEALPDTVVLTVASALAYVVSHDRPVKLEELNTDIPGPAIL